METRTWIWTRLIRRKKTSCDKESRSLHSWFCAVKCGDVTSTDTAENVFTMMIMMKSCWFPTPLLPRRVPNKSISWRILDNRRCRPRSDEVQFIDLEPVDDTNGAKSCFGKALAQRPRTESKYGSRGWRLVFQWETTLCSLSPLIPITAHVESDTRFGAKTANKFSGLDMTASKNFLI